MIRLERLWAQLRASGDHSHEIDLSQTHHNTLRWSHSSNHHPALNSLDPRLHCSARPEMIDKFFVAPLQGEVKVDELQTK